jgi:gamma-glutamyltranspeptidase/glutathione hydrolase
VTDGISRWPEARAARGMVAAPHVLAAESAVRIFAGGGNAIDAAIAAAATIAVVYPHMNGIGGDNFWLIFDGERDRLLALNASGRSAAAATLTSYAALGPTIAPRGGPAALTVPGAVSGWWEAHRYSRDTMGSALAWNALLDDAIAASSDGIPVSAGQRRVTASAMAAPLFAPTAPVEVRQTLWPIFAPDRLGRAPFVQHDLAATLAEIAKGGADSFYQGRLGARIVAGAAEAGSPLTRADFVAHAADWVDPLRVRYRNGEATSFPPPTQGFAALAILALLEGFDVARLSDTDHIHLVVEATKVAFEDRDRYLTDPTVCDVPVARCLDPERLARRRARIRNDVAMMAGGPSADGDTIAIVTADEHGNAVCVIQSLYHEFGSGVVAGDTGVLLQNRGAFFSLDPAHPNCLAPGKRTAHTLIPSMYLVNGRPRFVYGTMGGEGQPQTQAALVTRLVDRGLGVQAAVEAPRWLYGRTWGETSKALRLESRFDDDVAGALRRRGHDVVVVAAWDDVMGHAQVIGLDEGVLTGGSDPRADGAALGW